MPKKVNKGTYYKYKTKKWFQEHDYFAEYLEKNMRLFINGKIIFVKRDVAGSDGLAMNKKHVVFWQSKLNKDHVAAAVDEFNKFPFPKSEAIERWIMIWTKGNGEPEIIKVPVQ